MNKKRIIITGIVGILFFSFLIFTNIINNKDNNTIDNKQTNNMIGNKKSDNIIKNKKTDNKKEINVKKETDSNKENYIKFIRSFKEQILKNNPVKFEKIIKYDDNYIGLKFKCLSYNEIKQFDNEKRLNKSILSKKYEEYCKKLELFKYPIILRYNLYAVSVKNYLPGNQLKVLEKYLINDNDLFMKLQLLEEYFNYRPIGLLSIQKKKKEIKLYFKEIIEGLKRKQLNKNDEKELRSFVKNVYKVYIK